jgi:hypothetical protein
MRQKDCRGEQVEEINSWKGTSTGDNRLAGNKLVRLKAGREQAQETTCSQSTS